MRTWHTCVCSLHSVFPSEDVDKKTNCIRMEGWLKSVTVSIQLFCSVQQVRNMCGKTAMLCSLRTHMRISRRKLRRIQFSFSCLFEHSRVAPFCLEEDQLSAQTRKRTEENRGLHKKGFPPLWRDFRRVKKSTCTYSPRAAEQILEFISFFRHGLLCASVCSGTNLWILVLALGMRDFFLFRSKRKMKRVELNLRFLCRKSHISAKSETSEKSYEQAYEGIGKVACKTQNPMSGPKQDFLLARVKSGGKSVIRRVTLNNVREEQWSSIKLYYWVNPCHWISSKCRGNDALGRLLRVQLKRFYCRCLTLISGLFHVWKSNFALSKWFGQPDSSLQWPHQAEESICTRLVRKGYLGNK